MQLGYNLIDKTWDEFLREIGELARNQNTIIFLDTNILAYLYKLHASARAEFFMWTSSALRENRLKIPAWSASEYLSRVKKRELHLYTPKNNNPDQHKKALGVMHETAALFVDDTVLRSIGFERNRADFLAEFRRAIDKLPEFTRAFNHQFNPEDVHEEIQKNLSTAILDSDLAGLCIRAVREGDARFEHRLPPGFRDENKGENRFGDLIIWFEILQYSKEKREAFPKVLFVTNDEKSDWVYAPQRRMEADVKKGRIPVPNRQPDLKVIDPRLVSEFQRVVKHKNIVICSLPSLIEGLSKDSPLEFGQLAAAIQINHSVKLVEDSVDEASNIGGSDLTVASGYDAIQIEHIEREPAGERATTHRLIYDPDALRDGAYESDVPTAINEIIRALKSHNWYTQNPAIDRIRTIREEAFFPTSWFVLGRNIYQTACGNSQKAMDFMVNLDIQLSRFPLETAKHLLAGMLFEIYFDSHGDFRHRPKAHFIEMPLQQVVAEQFSDVCDFILGHLHDHRTRLRFLPGNKGPVTLRLTSGPVSAEIVSPDDNRWRELRSAQIYGVELIGDREDSTDRRYGIQEFTTDTLVEEISRIIAIPRWAINQEFDPEVNPDVVFMLPEGRMLHVKAALPEGQS